MKLRKHIFFRSFFNCRSLRFLDCFTGQSPGSGRNKLAISIPVPPALQGSWPSPSQSSLTRGWEAAGLGGWGWGFGQELAPERIIPFNIGKMGAVLVEEAGGKGLQGSMGQQGRQSVDEGRCHRVLEEARCSSGFRVCEEVDKTGGFFAPSSPCFYAKDDESTSSAAHERGMRAPFCVGLRSRRCLRCYKISSHEYQSRFASPPVWSKWDYAGDLRNKAMADLQHRIELDRLDEIQRT